MKGIPGLALAETLGTRNDLEHLPVTGGVRHLVSNVAYRSRKRRPRGNGGGILDLMKGAAT